jgi:AcrR family transcriptional regulator
MTASRAQANQEGDDLIAQGMALLAERGWQHFSLAELAERSGRSLADVYAVLPTRGHLITGLGRRLDRAMLTIDQGELADLAVRERLFELVMRRLEAAAPFKPGLRRLARECGREPGVVLLGACNLDRTAGWLLDAAGADFAPVLRSIARRALVLAYTRVFRTWLGDDTPDLARTLAELDKRLQQLERLAGLARRTRPTRPGAAADPA